MWIVQLAWKNIWRNRNRTTITMAAIFFAVLLSVLTSSLKTGIFDNLINNIVSFYSGYIQVHKEGYWNEQILDNSFETAPGIEKKILSDKRIKAISPRLESFALASSGEITKGCLVTGVDPERENQITSLKAKLIQGKYIHSTDKSVLITEGLMNRLKLKILDTIVLIGQGYHGSTAAGKYRIQGVLKFGSPDLNDKVLFMPLLLAQDLYGAPGMISTYVLSINNTNELYPISESVKKNTGAGYEVLTWEDMMPDIKQHVRSDSANMEMVQAVLYLLISFGIFGTLLMMMAERKFELGMLVAIGMKKYKLAILLMTESVLTILGGCLLGIIASIPLVFYLHKRPIRIGGEMAAAYEKFGFEAVFPTSVDAGHFIVQGVMVLLIGLMLSLYPVYKIIRLNPVEAMRK